MDITSSQQGTVSVLSLLGRADSVGATQLEQALQQAPNVRVVLDMSQLVYINSAALRVLAAALTDHQQGGGDLLLVAPPRKVRRIFEIIGFDRFFRMVDTVEAAVGEF